MLETSAGSKTEGSEFLEIVWGLVLWVEFLKGITYWDLASGLISSSFHCELFSKFLNFYTTASKRKKGSDAQPF